MGGGYAGTVTHSSKVTIDGNTFLHRVYGGGFGDPYKTTDNTTGQIGHIKEDLGSRSEVYVKGGNIYGDVFGGGAGVAPKTADGIHFENVARVNGNTMVEVSNRAKIYGKVFGGGDMANVGPKDYTPDYSIKPQSYSNINDEGDIIYDEEINPSYIVNNYRTLVNIIGGDIYGSVYGGGKGLPKAQAASYEKVGRINGNTIVHVANTSATSINSVALDYSGNTVPYVWGNIYGGCAYGTVDGNTLVHIEGGMLGKDIFGGGFGDIVINKDKDEDEKQKVLGWLDTEKTATYANILGNTKVQMDGGTWIWNQNADINGNITTWLAAQGNSQKICNSIIEFKEITDDILKAENINDLPEGKAKNAISRILTDKDTRNSSVLPMIRFSLEVSRRTTISMVAATVPASWVPIPTETLRQMEPARQSWLSTTRLWLISSTRTVNRSVCSTSPPCRVSAGISAPRMLPTLSSLFSVPDMVPTPRWLRRRCMHSRVAI